MSRDLAPDAPLEQVEWRVQGKIDRGDGVQVVAYLDAPTISRLLDEWVGPDRWRDHYEPTGKAGTMWCHLSIRFDDEWVTKEDLGTASDMEADKGLVSDAFKRVAMRKWGVGRNVFDLPILRITQFRKVERQGKDPMAYLTDESHAEIARLLTSRGFTEAAERTRVNAAADAAGADQHEALMRELDEVIVEAEGAGVEFDSAAARRHARGGAAPAQRSIQVLRQRIAEKASQEGADGDGPSPDSQDAQPQGEAERQPEAAGEPDEDPAVDGTPSWREQADAAGVSEEQLLIALQASWPANDQAAKPTRTRGLDAVAGRHEGLFASVIERLAQEQRQGAA